MNPKQCFGKGGLLALCVLLGVGLPLISPVKAMLLGGTAIAGYGPEQPTMERLARAFEHEHPGAYVDIHWHQNLKAVDLVKSGDAKIAVTGQNVRGLKPTQIAWDGIAIVVNFTNPIDAVTSRQVASIFTGEITRWSELGGPDRRIEVILRPPDRNIDAGFKESLGIDGRRPRTARTIGSDQRAFSLVSGDDTAVTYMSLDGAIKARRDGIPIRILLVDKVEAGAPTVRNGRYQLRRPVFLITQEDPDPVTRAFLEFAQSGEGRRIVREQFVPYEDLQ